MADKIFVDGIFVKTIQTQYGDIDKFSYDVEKFIEFARKHAQKSEKNGRWYLNTDFLSTQAGKKYMALDTFKPDPNKAQQQAPQAQQPPQEAFPNAGGAVDDDCPFSPLVDIRY